MREIKVKLEEEIDGQTYVVPTVVIPVADGLTAVEAIANLDNPRGIIANRAQKLDDVYRLHLKSRSPEHPTE